jgi:hypothetical protein
LTMVLKHGKIAVQKTFITPTEKKNEKKYLSYMVFSLSNFQQIGREKI